MRPRPLAVAILCGSALSAGQRAHAQDAPIPSDALQPVLEGHNLRVTSGGSVTVVDLGCEGRTSLRTQNKLFVACGADGVVEVDLSNPLAPDAPAGCRSKGMPRDSFFATGAYGSSWLAQTHGPCALGH